jgi:hypothetical protein
MTPRRATRPHVVVVPSFRSSIASNDHHHHHRHHRTTATTTRLHQAADDFDQTKYTDAAWSAIAALPAVADAYGATSVDAPMLLSVQLNPTKYRAGDNALTARQVVVKLLQDCDTTFDIDDLRSDVEAYLDKRPKVSGTGLESQKRMGRTLADVEQARDAVSALYQQAGYQSVYVELPEQQVSAGVVLLKVQQTPIGELRVVGAAPAAAARIRARVPALAEGLVPDFDRAQKELTALNEGGRRQVMPLVREGKTPGTMDVKPAAPSLELPFTLDLRTA